MSQYPITTDAGQLEAVNYVASGPSGLGQYFQGYMAWAPGYLNPNTHTPYVALSFDYLCTGVSGAYTISVTPNAAGVVVGMTVSGYAITAGTTVTALGTTSDTGTLVTLSNPLTDDIDGVDLTFTPAVIPQIYIPRIYLSNAELLDPYTWKFTFSTPQAIPPYVLGTDITVYDTVTTTSYVKKLAISGGTKAVLATKTTYSAVPTTTTSGTGTGLTLNITLTASGAVLYDSNNTTIEIDYSGDEYVRGDTVTVLGTNLGGTSPANDLYLTVTKSVSDYDGDYAPVGVVQCTTNYVIAKTLSPYTASPYVRGGYILVFFTSQIPKVYPLSTDCNEKVTVTGGTDRVFISAQLNNVISYTATTSIDLNYAVAINRYKGFPNNDPANPGYYFQFDKTICKQIYSFPGLTGTGTLPNVETIFSTFPDTGVRPGYYWYIMDVTFQRTNGTDNVTNLQVTQSTLGFRSISTQVVKE
jgi:hypothetical protein